MLKVVLIKKIRNAEELIGMSILIVDDSNLEKKVLQDFLKEAGFETISVDSAEEAFTILGINANGDSAKIVKSISKQGRDIETIFMDFVMPGMNGIEACKVIKRSCWHDVPIIMITSSHEEDILENAFAAGVMDYVTKPVSKVELLARLRSAVNLKQELDARREYEQKLYFELNLAKGIQRQLLSADFKESDIVVNSIYHPSEFLSGDMYYWTKISQSLYGMLIFDVTGQGIPASLISIFISSVAQEVILNFIDPAAVMQELNQRMCEFSENHSYNRSLDGKFPLFFSALYLTIDTAEQRIDYVNASHAPGILHMFNTAGPEVPDTVLLKQGTACLGLFDDVKIEHNTIFYDGWTRLVLSSDGLLESLGESQEAGLKLLTKKLVKSKNVPDDGLSPYILGGQMRGDIAKKDICLVTVSLGMADA